MKKKPVSMYKTIDDIFKAWDILTHINDKELIFDIKSAMIEAYMVGCACGGMDSKEFQRALKFCKGL